MSTSGEDKLTELLAMIDSITDDTPATVKHEIFAFIRLWWSELGENLSISTAICGKLGISRQMFNLYLNNPELVYGLETLHRNVGEGWLRSYLDFTSGHEAPEDFHVWVGLTVMAACLRRKVWFDNVFYKLYPNLYTILVAPPGVGKKTTAIGIGMGILRAAVGDLRIINEKVTPEALAQVLSKPKDKPKETGGVKILHEAQALIVAPELTIFLGREQYNEGLIILLTRLYDCSDILDVSTVSRGTSTLRNICVSLIGATTPTEIGKAIPASATGGGFMSRIHIVQKESSPRFFPFAIKHDETLRELLISQLAKINELEGPFTFGKDAKEWYTEYYRKHKESFERGLLAGANAEREPDHIIKLAMLLSISEGKSFEFTTDVMQRAFNILRATQAGTTDILKMIDTSDKGRTAATIVDTIRKMGGTCSRSQLTKKLYRKMDGREIANGVVTLLDAKVLTAYMIGKVTYIRLTSFDDKDD